MSIKAKASPLTNLDFTGQLPCEGTHHQMGLDGHVSTEPGAFFLVSPCGSARVVQCRSRIFYMRKLKYLMCLTCQELHDIDTYQISPI